MKSGVRTEPLVCTTLCRAVCSPLGQMNLIRAAQPLVWCDCCCKQFIWPPQRCLFFLFFNICSVIEFWSRGGGKRGERGGVRGRTALQRTAVRALTDAPAASFDDCWFSFPLHSTLDFLLFCHSGVSVCEGRSRSLQRHVTRGSRF